MMVARFSISGLLRTVAFCAFGMACLLYASAPWALALCSITLGLLVLALIGIACRAGARRAYWIGFAIAGWTYALVATGPWFHDTVARRLVTTRFLTWAYPNLVPEQRQAEVAARGVNIRVPTRVSQLDDTDIRKLLRWGANVFVKDPGQAKPTLLMGGVPVTGANQQRGMATLLVTPPEAAQLRQTLASNTDVILEPVPAEPFAPLWTTPPVDADAFNEVGHSLFALLASWIGGLAGRRMYTTRALAS